MFAKLCDEFLYLRIEDLVEGLLDGEGDARVVYILRGEPEMYELLEVVQPPYLVKLFLDEILYRLYVVVGYLFYIFHTDSIGFRKTAVDVAKAFKQRVIEAFQLRKGQFAESDEILYLDADAIANKCKLGKISSQTFGFTSVAAINWRHGCQSIKGHKW